MKNKLLLLVLVVIIKQIVWIAFIPLWHFPDEQAHFGQVGQAVEVLKRKPEANLTKEILISERILQTERNWAGNNKFTYHPEYNIPYSTSDKGFYEKEIQDFPVNERSIVTKREATLYPPLYYLPGVVIYKLLYNQDLFIRVFAVRLFNLFYIVILLVLAYRIFNLIFQQEITAYLLTIVTIFHPMLSFTLAGFNSDNLFNVIFTAGIYISLRLIKFGIRIKELILTILLLIVAFYTKPQWYLLLLILFVPFIYVLVRSRSRKFVFKVLLLAIIAILPLIYRWSKGMLIIPDISFVNVQSRSMNFIQFFKWSLMHSYREVLPWYWGVFRWLSLALPSIANKIINRMLLVSGLGLFIYLIRILKNKDFSFKNTALIFFAVILLLYFLMITMWDYLFYITHGFSFGIQGRYFFPVISASTGVVIFGFLGFSKVKDIQIRLVKIVALLTILLHEVALFWVISSYYSISSFADFFTQASQYKPWFFKSPVLQFILLAHFVVLIYISFQVVVNNNQHEKTRN